MARAVLGSLAFFIVAPATFGGLVPGWLTGWWDAADGVPAAVTVLGAGIALAAAAALISAFVRFAIVGRGTPAPVAPTERLVIGGLYRHVRNPMYVAVTAAIAGQAIALGHPALLAYAAVFLAVTATFVRLHEEPALRRRYGEQYEEYRRTVPGWLPRLRSR